MVNYAISDMMTRLRNAIRAKKPKVAIISTKMTRSIAEILKNEGYILAIEEYSDLNPLHGKLSKTKKEGESTGGLSRYFEITLKYKGKQMIPVLTNLQALSKPGVRFYRKSNEIPQVLGGLGLTILSTSKGIFPDHKARELSLGGEILCMVW
jgi:small subunit ribosomal protein S8